MDSFFVRFKNPLVLLALVLVQTIALAVQVQRPLDGTPASAPDGRKTTLLRYWAVSLVTPFERLARGSSFEVRSVLSDYVLLRHTHQQNAELQLEVARLRQEQAAFAEDAAQGRRLQALLNFRQHYIAATVAAQVIGTSGSDRSRIVYLDKGSADGLKPDQPVMTPDGIVGKLRDVFPHSAQVLLINDSTSGAGVILASSRIRGVIRGTTGGKVQINNLTADSRIKPGDKVVTSGGDQVFPRGLAVGVVESIVPDPEHQPYTAITIKPAADLSRIEEVLVITATQSEQTQLAQQDAATAEATAAATTAAQADAAKRAADQLSVRLPGAHDADNSSDAAKTDTTIGGLPNIPNSGVPRVQPALHPDHYTPGSTPSADQLVPGGAHAATTMSPSKADPDKSKQSEPN